MRKGANPAKKTKVESRDVYHRIIMPVYVPHLNDFFEQSLEVLKLSLNSIYTTVHEKTAISVVSNGSCDEANTYLLNELEEKRIDELVVVKAGIGKINSIFKVVNNAVEPLITFTDADVLFKKGWQSAVEQTFLDYAKVGMVCPFSYNKGFRELTSNIYVDNFFSRKIKKVPILNPGDLDHFEESIGNDSFYRPVHKKWAIGYSEKGKKPVLIGAGHFVATFKREVFGKYIFNPNLRKIANGERKYIDTPAVKSGLWRVSTQESFVYHMGNTVTKMYSEQIVKNEKAPCLDFSDKLRIKRQNRYVFWFKNVLLGKIVYSNKFLKFVFKRASFSDSEAREYLGM